MAPGQLIRDIFQSHQDAVVGTVETQQEALTAAAQCVVTCLLDEGRLFVCGSGGSAANAHHFTVKMLYRLERDRPGLPVFCLSDGAPLLTSLAANAVHGELFARPLRALGRQGDLLIALSGTGMSSNAVQAILAAHERGMRVIALTGQDGGDMARVLAVDDIQVRVPTTSAVRTEEVHLLLINALCELVERELFGAL